MTVGRSQFVKKLRESARGSQPSRSSIADGGVYVGRAALFTSENPIFQSKKSFLADFAPGDAKHLSKIR